VCRGFFRTSCELFRYCGDVHATKEEINRALAAEIKAAYIREGMTAAQVAEQAGFSTGTMTRILAGEDLPVSRLYMIASVIPNPDVTALSLAEAAVARAERD
jgi:hypothetical protein